MIVHGLLALAAFAFDVNSPYGDPRERQNPSLGVHYQTSIALSRLPQLALRFDAPLRLTGNANSALPHSPADAEWGVWLRWQKPGWYVEAGHSSWHRISPQVFDTRQHTGAELGFTW